MLLRCLVEMLASCEVELRKPEIAPEVEPVVEVQDPLRELRTTLPPNPGLNPDPSSRPPDPGSESGSFWSGSTGRTRRPDNGKRNGRSGDKKRFTRIRLDYFGCLDEKFIYASNTSYLKLLAIGQDTQIKDSSFFSLQL